MARRSAFVDTRVNYCGDNLERLKNLPPKHSTRGATAQAPSFLVSFASTGDALTENGRFWQQTKRNIIPRPCRKSSTNKSPKSWRSVPRTKARRSRARAKVTWERAQKLRHEGSLRHEKCWKSSPIVPFRRIFSALKPKPLVIAAAALPAAVSDDPRDHGARPQSRVLLLDDREDFRDVIGEFLGSRLYTVTAVSNGAEGLREIMKEPFDFIICDMMMPQVGGEMFYWAVTRLRPAAGLRFIFITGHQSDPKIQCFFNRISATVLIKPFPLDALSAAIREVTKKLR